MLPFFVVAALGMRGDDMALTSGVWDDVFEHMEEQDVLEDISCGRTRIKLFRPSDMDNVIEAGAASHEFETTRYMPYWASLWPVARSLAGALLERTWSRQGLDVLELGCGLGLCGIAALMRGQNVTFSDYDRAALRYASRNAEVNGFPGVKTMPLNWLAPGTNKYDVLVGSDLTYDQSLIPHLVNVFDQMLAPGGFILLADQNRLKNDEFFNLLSRRGFWWSTTSLSIPEEFAWDAQGSLYEIRRGVDARRHHV